MAILYWKHKATEDLVLGGSFRSYNPYTKSVSNVVSFTIPYEYYKEDPLDSAVYIIIVHEGKCYAGRRTTGYAGVKPMCRVQCVPFEDCEISRKILLDSMLRE